MRVLIIHNRYRQPGGEDAVAQSQADLLRSRGHQVRLFEKDNKAIDSYGFLRRALLFFETTDNPRAAAEVAKLAAEFKPDAAHIHNTLPLLSPSIYKPLKKAGVKIIQYLHNYRLVCPAGTLFREGRHCQLCVDGSLAPAVEHRCWSNSKLATLAVTRMLARHRRSRTWHYDVDLFVALNGYMRDIFVNKRVVPADKLVVQGNFTSVASVPVNGAGEGFVFLGRAAPEKGAATLMKAAANFPENTLTIIGDDAGSALADDLPSADVISPHPFKSIGWQPRNDALQMLGRARALVFPSEWQEPFGLGIIEAMALSRPVIASRVAGPKEIVQDGVTGLLFEPGNVGELAACMKRLQENPALAVQFGKAGRARYEQEYSPEAGYARMLDNYRRLGLSAPGAAHPPRPIY